jgi:homoserine kinase type II
LVESHFWELTPWLPGAADYHANSSEDRLRAALSLLARFHVAAATFPGEPVRVAPSPGLNERVELLQHLIKLDGVRIARQLDTVAWPELVERSRRLLPMFRAAAPTVERELKAVVDLPLPQQPTIRDIWHDHVLFRGDEVTGLIDFGAMRIESVAGDVGRLLGSLARDDAGAWEAGLSAYESIRPLSADERRAVRVFDRSTTLLSGMSWLRWICLDGRTFDDRARVLARLDENLARFERLLDGVLG